MADGRFVVSPPSPRPSPPGSGRGVAPPLITRESFVEIPAFDCSKDGARFSLSPGERAGVRAVVGLTSFVGTGNRIAVRLPKRFPHIFCPAASVMKALG